MLAPARAQTLHETAAKGAMPPLMLVVDDCRAAYDGKRASGVEFMQEPVARRGSDGCIQILKWRDSAACAC